MYHWRIDACRRIVSRDPRSRVQEIRDNEFRQARPPTRPNFVALRQEVCEISVTASFQRYRWFLYRKCHFCTYTPPFSPKIWRCSPTEIDEQRSAVSQVPWLIGRDVIFGEHSPLAVGLRMDLHPLGKLSAVIQTGFQGSYGDGRGKEKRRRQSHKLSRIRKGRKGLR